MAVANFSEQQLRQFVLREVEASRVAVLARQLQEGVLVGDGSPENVVVAPVGTLYRRRDGGVGTCLYVKESGVGDSGWVAK